MSTSQTFHFQIFFILLEKCPRRWWSSLPMAKACPCPKSGVMFSTSWSDSPASSMGSGTLLWFSMILGCFSLLVRGEERVKIIYRWYFRIGLLLCYFDITAYVLSGKEIWWWKNSVLGPSLDVPSPHLSLHPRHDLQFRQQTRWYCLSCPAHRGPPGLYLVHHLAGHSPQQEVQLFLWKEDS